jgi:Ca2+-binding EF-hand superfamily protein
MKYLLIVLSLALLSGFCILAGPQREQRFVLPVQAALDANGDGLISGEELGKAAVALRKLDKNSDGRLTEEELRPAFDGPDGARPGGQRRGPGGPAGGDINQELVDTLMGFDENKDGKLTISEVPERMQGIFTRSDANKDGSLTREELTAAAKTASSNPVSNDRGGEGDHHEEGRPRGNGPEGGPGRGFPGRGGRGDMMRAFPLMAALDADGDRVISAAEIDNASVALKSLDKDGDGQLSGEELRPAFGRPPGAEDRH